MSTQTNPPPPFPFPREYHFPAFYTRQTNLTTHHAQLTKWTALILSYAQHHRIFKLSPSSAAETELFYNKKLERRLQLADIKEVLGVMRREGTAEVVGAGTGGGGGGGGGGSAGDVVFLYWKTPEEWAGIVDAYVDETGQRGGVLTVYELCEGEGTRGTELHGMDKEVMMKALNILVKRGKAQIFGQDDSLGVKFF